MTQLGKNNLFVLLSLCHCYQEAILLLMIILVYDALIPGRSPTILDQLKGWQWRLKQLWKGKLILLFHQDSDCIRYMTAVYLNIQRFIIFSVLQDH